MSDSNMISAVARSRAGKGAARADRRAGRVPAVIYGEKKDPILVSLDPRVIQKSLDTGAFFSTVYDVEIEGAGKEKVLPRDVQTHPVTDAPMHVDFLRVSGDAKIAVNVPMSFINEEECDGIKRGGLLNVVRHEVELLCSVDSIPQMIECDLTGYDIGDSIHISAIKLPEGVNPTITDRDFTVATIAAPSVKEEELVTAEPGEEGVEGEEAPAAEGEEAVAAEGTGEAEKKEE